MARKKKVDFMDGWVTNNIEKTKAYNLHVGNKVFTPDNYIKISSLDEYTVEEVKKALKRNDLINIDKIPKIIKPVSRDRSNLSRIVYLPNGSVVLEPYKVPDIFVSQGWFEIAQQVYEIDNITILEQYKERAEALLKPKKVVDIIDARIRDLLAK